MNWIRSTVLDVDQLVLNSREAHAHSWVEALQTYGIHTLFGRVRPMMGLEEGTILRRLTGLPETTAAGRRILHSKWLIFRSRYLPALRGNPDARELVNRMREDGVRVAIGSNGGDSDLQLLMDAADVADHDVVHLAAGAADGPGAKNGSFLAAAASALGERGPAVAAIVDTPHEVSAALKAGCTPIALRSGGWDDDTLEGAAAIYDDLTDLLAHYERTPLAIANPESGERLVS